MSALSSPFQRSLSSSNTCCTCWASVVSATNPSASGLPRSVRSLAAVSRTFFVRPTRATRAPSSARQRAVANPIPRPPPTTTAVASFSPRSMARLLRAGPIGRALLGERDRALPGVVGGEDGNDVFEHAPMALNENFLRHSSPFTVRPILLEKLTIGLTVEERERGGRHRPDGFPVRLTVTAERRHACKDADQT